MIYKIKHAEFRVFSAQTISYSIEKTNALTGLKNGLLHPAADTVFRDFFIHLINIASSRWKFSVLLHPEMKRRDNHIQTLIQEGEHQMLDFKFEISDSRRIARSLAAFANTDGGRLLVGVKDNGAIAGVRSDEEIHMIAAAAEMYCQPPVRFTTEEWEINGKTVLEVIINKDLREKHKAPDNQGQYKIFVRVNDENLVADNVLIKVWKSDRMARPAKIAFTDTEMLLLHHLSENKEITVSEFQHLAHISKRKAEAILADFVIVGTIELIQTSQNTVFRLVEEPKTT